MVEATHSTSLTQWLIENGAKDYVETFIAKGFSRIGDLDDGVINTVIPADKEGVSKRLTNALSDWKKQQLQWKAEAAEREQKKRELQPLPIPPLPAGTELDLSATTVTTPQGITFQLPNNLSVAATSEPIDDPSQIASSDWIILAKRTNMLRGSRMDKADPHAPNDSLGKHPVLTWKVPEDDSFVMSDVLNGSVLTNVSYTEQTSNFVSCGFDEESASASYLFCSASFDRTHSEKHARSQATTQLYMTGLWYFPAATLDLTRCTAVSPLFVKCVREALDGRGFALDPDNSTGVPATDLNAVFDYFGHAVATRVTIGAQLTFTQSVQTSANYDMRQVQETIKAAVHAKVGGGEGSAGTAFQTADKKEMTAKALAEKISFDAIGGDRNLASTPSAWTPTTKHWISWAVIRRNDLRPTYDLLPPELRQRVVALWPQRYPVLRPIELPWAQNSGAVVQTDTSGFLVATVGELHDGDRGSATVYSGPSEQLDEDGPQTAAGAAYAHYWTGSDTHCVSSCAIIPIRQGGHYRYSFNTTYGSPGGRLLFVPSFLKLGDWIPLDSPLKAGSNGDDGFLFVSIDADSGGGDRGAVLSTLDGAVVAGASVHAWPSHDVYMNRECFCVPVPAGAKLDWAIRPTYGSPRVRAYWMPFEKNAVLHFGKREARAVETVYTAETAGIIHGYIEAANDGDRGTLEIYSPADSRYYAAASVHKYSGADRWVWCNSVFFPIAKGDSYRVHRSATWGLPNAHLFWTPVLPR